MSLAPGSELLHYRIVEKIGEGGMGEVYRAQDTQLGRDVAIKVLPDVFASDPNRLTRFEQEARFVASLNHPNVARLFDGGVMPNGRPYLVMEYIEGEPIDRYCDARTLSLNDRLRLFRAIVETVQYAHRNLIVHRDLKPSNILVTEEGTVKLLDFGIAKLIDDDADSALTRTGMRVLTPAYAAPEQVAGEPVTTAADVYSLGVVFYELLTGHNPHGETPTKTSEIKRPSAAVAASWRATCVSRDSRTVTIRMNAEASVAIAYEGNLN